MHVPIIGLSVLPILLGQPLILAPIHIAFFELVIDPACSVVFDAEEGAPDLMARPPRSPAERLLSAGDVALSLVEGGAACVAVAVFYAQCLAAGVVEEARALAFVALVAANCALIVACRSSAPAWRRLAGFPRVGTVVIAATLTVSAFVTFQPDIAKAFAFQPPSSDEWLSAFLVGAGMLLFFESAKAVRRRT